MNTQIIRLPRVLEMTARSRATTYARIASGEFVPPVKIGLRSVGWPLAEIERLNAAHIAGKSTDEIKALVSELVAARSGCGA
jgi:prophage regulatory protein